MGVRVHERGENELVRIGIGDAVERTPVVQIDVCRCGHAHAAGSPHVVAAPPPEPDWALASAWSWLTRPVETDEPGSRADVLTDDTAAVRTGFPWWDARSRPERRRVVFGAVLLGELQAGVLLRAVWEVAQSTPPGPLA